MGSLTRIEKETYLKMNGWWAHYHRDCWFDGELDELEVNDDGLIIGFRPEEEGITLEEAYNKLNQNKGDEDWVDGEMRDNNASDGDIQYGEYDDDEYDY